MFCLNPLIKKMVQVLIEVKSRVRQKVEETYVEALLPSPAASAGVEIGTW